MDGGSLVAALNILELTTMSVPTVSLRNTQKFLSVLKYRHLNPLNENKELGLGRCRPFICQFALVCILSNHSRVQLHSGIIPSQEVSYVPNNGVKQSHSDKQVCNYMESKKTLQLNSTCQLPLCYFHPCIFVMRRGFGAFLKVSTRSETSNVS